jgi:hypothetical protein
MRKTITAASVATAVSLFGVAADPAMSADRLVTPREGMVFSATSPSVGDCPAMSWYFRIGPNRTITGMVSHLGTEDVWRVKGTYTPNHTFHVDTQELTGQQKSGSVDGQVLQNGSLTMQIGNVAGASPCANKTIYIPWFRDGNAFTPYSGGGGG